MADCVSLYHLGDIEHGVHVVDARFLDDLERRFIHVGHYGADIRCRGANAPVLRDSLARDVPHLEAGLALVFRRSDIVDAWTDRRIKPRDRAAEGLRFYADNGLFVP